MEYRSGDGPVIQERIGERWISQKGALLLQFWNCEGRHFYSTDFFVRVADRDPVRAIERLLRYPRSFRSSNPAKTQADSSHDSIERVLKRLEYSACASKMMDSSHDSIERVLKLTVEVYKQHLAVIPHTTR